MRTIMLCTLLAIAEVTALRGNRVYAESTGKVQNLRLMVNLSDGSELAGVMALQEVTVQTGLGVVQIPLDQVVVFSAPSESGQRVLGFANGDKLSGHLRLEFLPLESLFGKVNVPMMHVKRMRVLGGNAGSGTGSLWENSLGMKFVPVPGIDGRLSIWETRVQDFDAFVRATGHDASEGMYSGGKNGTWAQYGDTWKSPGFEQNPTHPVVGVNWADAQAFCRWLTEKEQREGWIGAAQNYRLPTDAEWSLAVGLEEERGGTPKEKSGKIAGVYLWGNYWPPQGGDGNFADTAMRRRYGGAVNTIEGYDDGFAHTAPVGSFKVNDNGLYDMGGNVNEWCEELYDSRSDSESRSLRGACYGFSVSTDLLASYRLCYRGNLRYNYIGFRCVLAGPER